MSLWSNRNWMKHSNQSKTKALSTTKFLIRLKPDSRSSKTARSNPWRRLNQARSPRQRARRNPNTISLIRVNCKFQAWAKSKLILCPKRMHSSTTTSLQWTEKISPMALTSRWLRISLRWFSIRNCLPKMSRRRNLNNTALWVQRAFHLGRLTKIVFRPRRIWRVSKLRGGTTVPSGTMRGRHPSIRASSRRPDLVWPSLSQFLRTSSRPLRLRSCRSRWPDAKVTWSLLRRATSAQIKFSTPKSSLKKKIWLKSPRPTSTT